MHAGEDHGRRRSVAQQFIEEEASHFTGMRRVAKALLGRKCVALQPLEQLLAVGSDDVRLRIMDVGIDEAWSNESAAAVDSHGIARQIVFYRRPCNGLLDLSLADQQCAVVEIDVGAFAGDRRIVDEMQDFSSKDGHVGACCSRAPPTRRSRCCCVGHCVFAP